MTSVRSIGIGLIFTALFAFVGCAAPQRQTMPTIVIAPGLKERLAWMDRVRLHDEGRQTMMEAQEVARDDEDFVVEETSGTNEGEDTDDTRINPGQTLPRLRVRARVIQ